MDNSGDDLRHFPRAARNTALDVVAPLGITPTTDTGAGLQLGWTGEHVAAERKLEMEEHRRSSSFAGLSRRAVLGSAGAAVALGLGDRVRPVAAQEATPGAMASHPIVGTWMVTTPTGPSLAAFFADGTNIQGVPTTQAGPWGVTFTGAQVGTWEPDGDRRIHFTGVQLHTDASGNFVGTVTIDGHPRVSDDGRTLVDDAPETTVTVRDAANNVVNLITPNPGGPPATGVRMGVGSPGFPPATPAAGTPTT